MPLYGSNGQFYDVVLAYNTIIEKEGKDASKELW